VNRLLSRFNAKNRRNIISNMGHSRLDSVRLLALDGSVHNRGTDVVLYVTRDNSNLVGKMVKILDRPYGVAVWHDSSITSYIIFILHL
jgi:hypothetical protein